MEGYYLNNSTLLKNKFSEEEQNKYLILASQGDYNAQQKIFENNLRLVSKIISQYFSHLDDKDKEEAFQVGCIGLWNAITKYNPSLNVRFSSYAFPTILGEIKNSFRFGNLLSVPMTLQNLYKKIISLKQEYQRQGITLNEQELASILNVSEDEIVLAINSKNQFTSLSQPINNDRDKKDRTLEEILPDTQISIEEQIDHQIFLKELSKIINSLDEKEKQIIKMSFGIGCERKPKKEIAEILKISKNKILETKKTALIKIKKAIINNDCIKEEVDIPLRTKKVKERKGYKTKTPQKLFEQFPNYTKDQILEAINHLSKNNKKVISLVYNLDTEQNLTNEEIQQQLNDISKNVRSYIFQIRKQIKNILEHGPKIQTTIFDSYPNYTKLQVLEAINKLNPLDKEIIELKYGLNGQDEHTHKKIGNKLDIEVDSIRNIVYDIKKIIKRILENGITEEKTYTNIFDLYEEYSQEEVLEAIKTLKPVNKKIIELKYGLNGEKETSPQEIIEKINYPSVSALNNQIYSIFKQISNRLKKYCSNKQTIFEQLPNYTEEQILGAISTLDQKEREIIEKRYGLNGQQYTSIIDLAKINNLSPSIIRYKILEIQKKLNKRLKKSIFKRETIFDKIPEFTKEQVMQAIDMLEEDERNLINLRYGLKGYDSLTSREIKEKYNTINTTNKIHEIIRKIKRKLNSKKIFDFFPNYTEEEVLKAISKLSDEEREIIEKRYGLNGQICILPKDLSKQLNVDSIYITKVLRKLRNKIKALLNNKPINPKTIFDYFPDYTKEEILSVINTLQSEKKIIISKRYGLDGKAPMKANEIEKKYNIKNVGQKIFNIIRQINNRLYNRKYKKEIIYDYFPDYTKEQILGTISTLSKSKIEIISKRYGLNGQEYTTSIELAEQLNVTIEIMNSKIQQIREQIKRRLEKGQFKRDKINDLYPNYTEEQILGAISTLNEENKKIIEMKYGLNGNDYYETREISEMLNIEFLLLNSRLGSIINQIKGRLEKGQFKQSTIFDLYPNHTEEQVLGSIEALQKEEREIIEKRYGLNGEERTTIDKLSIIMKVNEREMQKKIYAIKKKIGRYLEKGKFKKESIFDYFSEFKETDVLKAIETLTEENKFIINLRYGLDGREPIKMIEIEKKYNIHRCSARVFCILEQIGKRLEKRQLEQDVIFDYFPNYTEDQILGCISSLQKEEREIIEKRYGLNKHAYTTNDKLALELNVSRNDISRKIYAIRNKIERYLEKGKFKKESIFDLYPDYTESEVLTVIESLKTESQYIINLRYGLDGSEPMKAIEIEKKYNIPKAAQKVMCILKQIDRRLLKMKIKSERYDISSNEKTLKKAY